MVKRIRLVAVGAALVVLAGAASWWLLHSARIPPGVTIAGGDAGGLPRATPVSENFDPVALDAAIEAAQKQGADVFLVARHGHLVGEYYARGFDANTVADAGGFATTLTALAGALALQEGLIDETSMRPFSAPRVVAAIDASKAGGFAHYVGEAVWKPVNAAPAVLAGARGAQPSGECCLYARITDWVRIGALLLDDGRFEGTSVLPKGMAARFIARDGVIVNGEALWLAERTRSSEPFTADAIFYMKGNGRWRMWMLPTLNVVVLFAAPKDKQERWQESRLPNLVTRAVKQNPHGDPHAGVGGVAPGF